MSYFSSNPEAWDEICNKAIVRKLMTTVRELQMEDKDGNNLPPEKMDVEEFLELLVEEMGADTWRGDRPVSEMLGYDVWKVLMDWASHETADFEADYFGGLTDDVMNRFEGTPEMAEIEKKVKEHLAQ